MFADNTHNETTNRRNTMSTTVMTHINEHTNIDAGLVQCKSTGNYVRINLGDDVTVFINYPHKLQEIIDAAQKAADEWSENKKETDNA